MMLRSALATAAAIRARETSAVAECEAAIARIEAGDTAINAVVVRDFNRARAAALAADARAAAGEQAVFLGVPLTVKESFDVEGLPTSWGYAEHADHVARADAVAVRRLKQAGAIILGKTNVPVGLADLQSHNPNYGRTSNPLKLDRVSGGSSGGAAAALAAGFVPIELGSDIGGSIRVPAAFCGVWGHKPSYGALPMDGHNFPRTDAARIALSVIGPMARDADDLAAELDVLSSIVLPRPAPRAAHEWRVLVLPEHPMARASTAMRDAVEQVGAALTQAGATVLHASEHLPDLGAQTGHYIRMLLTTMARGAPPAGGPAMTLTQWFDLLDEQARCQRAWARLFEDVDAVIAPAFGTVAFPHSDVPIEQRLLDIDGDATVFGVQLAYAGLATFPLLPATSVPVATDADGLPIGVQVITDYHQDHQAIMVARLVHDLMRS